jgi:hypothetical protein
MKFQDLTQEQIVNILRAAQMFFDGDFMYADQVQAQTGYDMEVSAQIAAQIRALNEIKFQ